ncbi:MAG: hypothetical protein MK135_03230 [Polyangiaceae bacterium]|nr:hypothetical protein [Polyangiaceae bacterium]
MNHSIFPNPSLKDHGEGGAITLEGLLLFLPFLLVFLGCLQLLEIWFAERLVEHAHYRMGRSLSVIADDPFLGSSPLQRGNFEAQSPRRIALRRATLLPLFPIAPSMRAQFTSTTVEKAWRSRSLNDYTLVERLHFGALMAIRLQHQATGPSLSQIDQAKSIYGVVSYLQRCHIPLVNRLLCWPLSQHLEQEDFQKRHPAPRFFHLYLNSFSRNYYRHLEIGGPIALHRATYLGDPT